MSTALALRLEFAMRSLEVADATHFASDDGLDPEVTTLRDRIAVMRKLVDQAIEELT